MDANNLFGMALGLGTGWKVVKSEMDVEGRRLRLWLDFEAGSRFACPECGEWSPVHDTVERQWRHLNFWQHETFLIARVPRTKCDKYFVAGHFKVHHLGALISTSKCTTSAAFF